MINSKLKKISHLPSLVIATANRAANHSKYSGVAWGIKIDKETYIKQTKYGQNAAEIFKDLRSYWAADEFCLSSPLDTGFTDPLNLQQAIYESGIKNIYLPIVSSTFSEFFSHITLDLPYDRKKHDYLMPPLGNHQLYGPLNLKKYKRPWNSGITATSLGGYNIPLKKFIDESGVSFRINQVISHGIVVIYFRQPIEDFSWLSKSRNDSIQEFHIKDFKDLKELFSQLHLMNFACITTIANFTDTQELLKHGYLDEVIYHIQIIGNKNKVELPVKNNFVSIMPDWKIIDCEQFDNGIKVTAAKRYCKN